jgi:tetratricopeptide (TPR) repeat protein
MAPGLSSMGDDDERGSPEGEPEEEPTVTQPFAKEEIADLFTAQGYPNRALPLLEEVVEKQPHRVDIKDKIDTLKQSVRTIERLSDTREMHPEVLAEAYERMGKPDKALATLEKLQAARPDDERLDAWILRLRAGGGSIDPTEE